MLRKVLVLPGLPSCTPSAIGWSPWARFTRGSMIPVVKALMRPLKASATTSPTATTTMSPFVRKFRNPFIARPPLLPSRTGAQGNCARERPGGAGMLRVRSGRAAPGRDGRMPVKVVVDFDVCTSNAVCMGIVPEVFEVRDDGFLYVLDEHPPEELLPRLREAETSCPTGAISLVEDGPGEDGPGEDGPGEDG